MRKKSFIKVSSGKVESVDKSASPYALELLMCVLSGSDRNVFKDTDGGYEVSNKNFLVLNTYDIKSFQVDLQPVDFFICIDGLKHRYIYDELQIFIDSGRVHARGFKHNVVNDNDVVIEDGFCFDQCPNIYELLHSDPYHILDAIKRSRIII